MIEISIAFIFSVFVAGLLMFLAPCTLPLVPAYLAFISGTTPEAITDATAKRSMRRNVVKNAVAFAVGFSLIFISFGVLLGFIGSQLGVFRSVLSQVGGAFIIVFGFMMLGMFKFAPLLQEHKVHLPRVFTPGHPFGSFVIGLTFALGWTPCVGPVLASVLLLASSSATALTGGLLLAVFSLGLAIPFILTALLYAEATPVIARVATVANTIMRVGGLFLIIIGILLLTDNFSLTVMYGYQLFEFLGFGGFFEHL